MKSKLTHLLGAAAAFLCIALTPAQAANINTGGNACHGEIPEDTVIIDNTGIRNWSTTSTTFIACSVARSALPAGASSALFYVDGALPLGGQIYCSMLSWDYTFTLLGATSFVIEDVVTFDAPLVLPAAQTPTWAYTMLFCSLPPGGRILGMTSVQ